MNFSILTSRASYVRQKKGQALRMSGEVILVFPDLAFARNGGLCCLHEKLDKTYVYITSEFKWLTCMVIKGESS